MLQNNGKIERYKVIETTMGEEPKTRSFLSSEDLLNAVKFNIIQINETDPNYEEVSKYVNENKDKIIERVKQEKGFWNFLHNEGEEDKYYKVHIEMEDFVIKLGLPLRDNLEAVIEVMSRKFEEEKGEEKALRTTHKRLPVEIHDDSYSAVEWAKKLGIEPLKQFQLDPSKRYDPSKVKDKLGLGLDSNIMELIHLLNLMGFETLASCGGHENRGLKPYIAFPWQQRDEIIALLAAWEEAGGAKYQIVPMGNLGKHKRTLAIETLTDVTLVESREDIDKLIDFLIEKTGGIPKYKLTLIEMTQRIRRNLRRLLK